jgi:hypothetical protein
MARSMLQRCRHLLQLLLEYHLVMSIMRSAMALGAHGNDRFRRIRFLISKPIHKQS